MPDYILDTCVDIEPRHANYPAYFFKDLHSNARVRLVIGGTKALDEAKSKTKLLDLLNTLRDRNQLVRVSTETVDKAEERLASRINRVIGEAPRECDDLHVFALAYVSGCLHVISRDSRMATCRNKIRAHVGHNYCPDICIIQNETAYNRTR